MFNKIDLQALAEHRGPERAFVSLYLSGPDALKTLEHREKRMLELLDEDSDELEHFERNMEAVREFLDDYDFESGSLCIFSCWATDYFQAFTFEHEVPSFLWLDSAPYIRPLAELQDEYENFVVVTADNSETRVFYVTSAVPKEEERIKGGVKNHVRKGGWSQQRYSRRRDNELLHYAKEVAEVLADLDKRKRFEYIFLVGSDEAMRAIEEELPEALKEKVAGMESVDLHQKDEVWDTVFEMFFKEERDWDRSLWEEIKSEFLRQGRAVTGPKHVLEAAAVGRVERMLVTRDAKIPGLRCRDCENLSTEVGDACPVCKSESVFKVDLVNELVELLATSHGEVEFTDHIRGLTKAGHVAALLRY